MAGIFKAYDIRGTYPEQVNETVAFRIGYHYRDLLDDEDLARGPVVVVGRDMRPHSEPLQAALKAGLRARGVAVVDIGLSDTPQNYFAVGHLRASGGIQVTASHNPPQYNGFKMSRRDAIPVSSDTGINELERLVNASTVSSSLPPSAGEEQRRVWEEYGAHVLSFLEAKGPRLKAAVDAANGMGAVYRPLLEAMNLELVELFCELDGSFPNHEPNPLKPENLVDVQRATREASCAVGFAFDGDADRVGVVDEEGTVVGADMVTALLAPRYLRREPGAVIAYDLRSSWATPEAIREAGGTPVRERVGHSFMKATMRRHGSPFGGELAGHFYFRDNFTADCSLLTVVQIVNHLRETGRPLSELVRPLRRYFTTGEVNFHVEDKQGMIRRLAADFGDGRVDYLDGITVEFGDWWFNVRPSNTEPLLRLVLEARTRPLMEEKRQLLLGYLGDPE